jgi:hypothetical protein
VRNRLLIFRGFAHDPQRVLAAVQPLTLVFGKLLPKAFLRVGRFLEGVERNLEVGSAASADAEGRCSPEPLDRAEATLFHASSVPLVGL